MAYEVVSSIHLRQSYLHTMSVLILSTRHQLNSNSIHSPHLWQ
nr:MAG TPA: hypothetical protein [Caudoviricetes sp.]